MFRWRLLLSDYFTLEMIMEAFSWGRAEVGGVPRAPVLAAAQRGAGAASGAPGAGAPSPAPGAARAGRTLFQAA